MFFHTGYSIELLDNILKQVITDPVQIDIISSIVHEISSKENIIAIYLYGSYVRHQNKPYSDVDIAVLTQCSEPERKTREWIGSFSSRIVDVQVFSDLPLPARMQVLTQGIPLYIRDEEILWNIIKSVSLSYMDLEPMRNRWEKSLLGV